MLCEAAYRRLIRAASAEPLSSTAALLSFLSVWTLGVPVSQHAPFVYTERTAFSAVRISRFSVHRSVKQCFVPIR